MWGVSLVVFVGNRVVLFDFWLFSEMRYLFSVFIFDIDYGCGIINPYCLHLITDWVL
jgi:hypothetical protein